MPITYNYHSLYNFINIDAFELATQWDGRKLTAIGALFVHVSLKETKNFIHVVI